MKWLLRAAGFMGCLAFVFVWIFWFHASPNKDLISPVLGVSKMRYSDNIWFPKEASASSFVSAPEISAESAFFVEANTGQVLFQKNYRDKKRIASLTKIMTAIIALENKKLSDTYTVSKMAAEMEPDKMLLKENERLTLEELLSGIFLVSANDAAEVLAEQSASGREEFINLMNTKTKILGMNDTWFINPSGLEEDDPRDPSKLIEHFSTAYDVALMSRYLISRWPEVINISSREHIYLPITDTHQDYDMYSGINLLTTYPGVMGLKTGYTPEAGLTLVTLAKKGNAEVLGVLLGATNRRDDAKAMLDYSFAKLGY